MTQILNTEGVSITIQAVGFEMTDFIRHRIANIIKKIRKLFPAVEGIAVHLKNTKSQCTRLRKLKIRFAVPGPDLIASGTGYSWKAILKTVEKKLVRQTVKRKQLTIEKKSENR